MEVINKSFNSLTDLSNNLHLDDIVVEKTLIQVFSGLNSESEIKQIQSIFTTKNPDVSFIGTTTAGEINNFNVSEKTIVVSIVKFNHTTVDYSFFAATDDDYELGTQVANTLINEKTKSIILFADGLQTNASDLIDGLNSVNNAIPVSGGLAGDNGNILSTYVFDKSHICSKGCVAAALHSDILQVFNDFQLNWKAIGQTMTITKAHKNRLYEINGMPASEIYKKYLGEKVSNNLPFAATEFPLMRIDDDGFKICRAFVHKFEDGSLQTIGNFEVGDKVRLAYGNVDLIVNDTQQKIPKYQQQQPEAFFTYNCSVRKSFLQSESITEIEPLAKIAPTCGFFSYGEFFFYNNQNRLLNIALTILGLREEKKKTSIPVTTSNGDPAHFNKNFITNKHFLALDALTTLSNTVIEELNQANKELEKTKLELERMATTDKLTGIFNRSKLDDLLRNEIERSKRYNKQFGYAIFDIDHFKQVNDTHGHLMGDTALQEIAALIKANIRNLDIFGRWGGEEFVLILPDLDENGMRPFLEKIRQLVSTHNIETIGCQTISAGATQYQPEDTAEKIAKRADDALYEAKKTGRNKIVIY